MLREVILVMMGGLGVAGNEKEKTYENVFEQYMYTSCNVLHKRMYVCMYVCMYVHLY